MLFNGLIFGMRCVEAQSTSQASMQSAANALTFLLQAPGNCLQAIADMPPTAPSKNLAALWIRAAFHDAGTFTLASTTGGPDGSLVTYQNNTVNAGLPNSLATRFITNAGVNISNADAIALGT